MTKKINKSLKNHISISKAELHNLKKLSVNIRRDALTVVTGVSGSGKSSLVFDTLFVEGQRRYVESVSTYVRQFLGRLQKPPVESIKGISPAVAIQQRGRSYNPRSTVGTMTEIYDYMRLLYARIGRTYAPNGALVRRDKPTDVLSYIEGLEKSTKYQIATPLMKRASRSLSEELRVMLQKGYTRLLSADNQVLFIEEIEQKTQDIDASSLALLIDRGITAEAISKEHRDRLSNSVRTAFREGKGRCFVAHGGEQKHFSSYFEYEGLKFMEPSIHMFSFNSAQGACSRCEGFGQIIGFEPDKVIPQPGLSVEEGAIVPWRGPNTRKWLEPLLQSSEALRFPTHLPYEKLSTDEKEILWKGVGTFKGLYRFFEHLETKKHKIQYRVMLARYQGKVPCSECKGSRLRKEVSYVRVGDQSISQLLGCSIEELVVFFNQLELAEEDQKVGIFLLSEIKERLDYLIRVGLGYLTLDRLSATLSGGEYQRIQLATALGRPLVGAMYILDEPTIGLHARDINQLVSVLEDLRDKGNPVIVVEHEEQVIRAADQIIDIGPGAGVYGGRLVFQGKYNELSEAKGSATADALLEKTSISLSKQRRSYDKQLTISGLRMNNLQNISISIPLGVMTVLTGVSGSGKSTVVEQALYPGLAYKLGLSGGRAPSSYEIGGAYNEISSVLLINQQPMGRSSRSNPVTYIKAYDLIRQLFAATPAARRKGLTAAHFSFNLEGGRCETCAGEGSIRIEMQFLADVTLVCDSCDGRRFNPSTLDVSYKGKQIDEVLRMSVTEAIDFFEDHHSITEKLNALLTVGLEYIQLGQSSSSLSGGEAQRLKLASFLLKKSEQHTLFIFDEPTTGLHMQDTQKLMDALQALVDMQHSVLIVEHNLDVIRSADWIIDLGPEAGARGGTVCFEGTPEGLSAQKNNHTAHYLREKMHRLGHA